MIRILEKSVADKIAAGEVVERPLSVVKELTENSIDAGARTIVIEIKNGGKSYIRVTDDGSGISAAEVETAFLRHATSKITEAKDLESIETLGFRGEALGSISAVSRVELLTKTAKDNVGTRLTLHGGEKISKGVVGCPDGTTFIVTDLFYNTPARLKFLKPDNVESSLIIDFVSQLALAYPKLRIRMINNGNILFSTTGRGDLYDCIRTIYGRSVGDELVPVDYTDDYLTIRGYVSAPMNNRTSRRNQVFFVNGRVINSKVIDRGVSAAYSDRMFEGRYPIIFLFLSVRPDKLDVNIHPNKREVKFDDEDRIANAVKLAIITALDSKDAIATVTAEKMDPNKESKTTNSPKLTELNKLFAITQNTKLNTEKQEQVNITNILSSMRTEFPKQEEKKEEREETITVEAPKVIPFRFDNIVPLGSIFGTYIMAVDGDTFYLIDQHAAHERCFYEKLLREFKNEEKHVQPLITPLVINITPAADAQKDSWLPKLEGMGFDIEDFGPNTYRIRAIPMFMGMLEASDFVESFLDNLGESNLDLENYNQLNKIITKSCKSAVKGNDILHMEEIKSLLNELSLCDNPYSCPHGRPTFVKFSKYELEKFFKRIQ